MTILDDLNPQAGHSSDELKMCAKCRKQKPIGCFSRNKAAKDGLTAYCRSCQREMRKGYRKQKNDMYLASNRFDLMTTGQLELKCLTIEELTGGFIVLEDGTKQDISVANKSFQTKFNAELNRRLNSVLRQGSKRALEVMYYIMDSDTVEPVDRMKASQWWIERVMGKTPEVLQMSLTEAPHESIFETLSGGTRDDHRKQIGQAIDAEIVDEDDDASSESHRRSPMDLSQSAQRVVENFSGQNLEDPSVDPESGMAISQRDDNGTRDLHSTDVSSRSESTIHGTDKDLHGTKIESKDGELRSDQSGTTESVVDEIARKRNEAKALKKRIADKKKKRYAARATGAKSLAQVPWLIDWRVHEHGLLACLVPPSLLSPARLDVINANDAATDDLAFIAMQRANKLAAQAERLKAKLEGMNNNG